MNLNKLRDRAYKTACEHGFHDEELSNEHCLCLVISELMEAVEADRKGKYFKGILTFEREFNRYSALVEEEKRFKCSFERHVKDISYSLIKIFGLAKHLDIDLLWHIEQKQRYNELIPYKHGKKY